MKRIFLLIAGCLLCAAASAQEPVTFTAQQDHQNMLDQLGIKSIRYAFDADESSPHAANYDESKANPFPVLPEILKTNDGKKVTTAKQWWEVRRPEIVEGFESEVYGRVPDNVPGVTWIVEAEEIETVGMIRAKAKQLRGHVDNSACPSINVDIKMVVVTPANAEGPVPLLMMFGSANLPNPVKPGAADMAVINKALRRMLENDPETAELMKKYPAWQPFEPANPFAAFSRPAQQTPGQDPPSNQQLLAAGWGYAMIDPGSIQADNGAGLTRGIIGLTNKGQPRKPDDWGSLRAWAWGAARGLDYLETDPDVDAKHVGIEGVSRYGKAALVTLAFEDRFYMGLIGSSGKGGATLHRRFFGEGLENLANSGEYHWMAGNYLAPGMPACCRWIPTSSSPSAPRASCSSATAFPRRATPCGWTSTAAGRLRWLPARCSSCSEPRIWACRTTTARSPCRRSSPASSTASWPGASTTEATPTART